MLLKRTALVMAAFSATSIVLPAPASAGQMIERDFYATYSGEYQDPSQVTHECEEGEQANLVLGEGVGKFIGRFDLRIEACVSATSEITGQVNGTAYYTAANGDLLWFNFDGLYEVDLAELAIISTLPATGVDGTGRFANVELGDGPGTAVDTNPINSGVSFGVVSGPIVFDASDRGHSR
jgi:hypothetical protein